MDLGLGLGQPGEDLPGSLLLPRAEPAASIIARMWLEVAVRVLRLVFRPTCVARKPCFLTSLATSRQPGRPSERDGLVDLFQRHAGVDQAPPASCRR